MKALAPLLALLIAGCSTTTRLDAAGDVHDLLVAVRDNDRAAFERHIDRNALRRQIEARMVREARSSTAPGALRSIGIALAQPGAAMTEAMLLQPRVLRMTAEHYGYTPDQPIPGRIAIAGSLKNLDDGRVCATRTKGGECLLIFTQRNGTWRLTGFEGELSDLRAALSIAK
ncbi:MAG TPA: DUF2939 domain-containing protein [Caulobacteraceae bacterium]|nr:DUF2939 domain-containing protein [Caulobacteraceae bacterium]